MQGKYILRRAENELREELQHFPVVALVGPRQVGKSTLAKKVVREDPTRLYLDLQLPSDIRKLEDAEGFLRQHENQLICLDEIQGRPDLFPLIRALVDMDRRPGRFLLLGSASQDLLRKEGESLAGRIHYIELSPLSYSEVSATESKSIEYSWWRGGFPEPFLSVEDFTAQRWHRNFIQTYCTRDIPDFGFRIPAIAMERCWRMLAHHHGSTLNSQKLGQSLDISHTTVRRYVDLLEQSFMIRQLRPIHLNIKKRLIKSPKVYIRDSGILHTLLEVDSFTSLFGHPVFGASWEGWCIEQICQHLPEWRASFYRDSAGSEVDLVLEKGSRRFAFEFKSGLSPKLTRGTHTALDLLQPERCYLVCPMKEPGYETASVKVCGIAELLRDL